MPWHDIAIQIRGSSVHDIARHFTDYWNFVNFQTKIDDDRELLNLAGIKHQVTSCFIPAKFNNSRSSSILAGIKHQVTSSKFAAAKNFFKKIGFRKKTGKVEPMIDNSEVT